MSELGDDVQATVMLLQIQTKWMVLHLAASLLCTALQVRLLPLLSLHG
jgi:hypothetical protein